MSGKESYFWVVVEKIFIKKVYFWKFEILKNSKKNNLPQHFHFENCAIKVF
jgi:hypothetical protein